MKFCLFILIFVFFFINTLPVKSQEITKSNTVSTKVGNPTQSPPGIIVPGNTNNSQLASVLEWDEKIVNALSKGAWGYFNILSTAISNGSYSTGTCPANCVQGIYWCTHSIVDAYNLAGIAGLSKTGHAAVVNMRAFWKSEQAASLGYKYVDYNGSIKGLAIYPGYAIFFESVAGVHTGDEHVALVKEISIDEKGDGKIDMYDSNYPTRSHHYAISGWTIINPLYPIRGFGGV